MTARSIIDAWDRAPADAIHPSRAVSEVAYDASGVAQAHQIAKVLEPCCRVVDFGCGDGRVTGPLHLLGFDVVGVDASANMVAAFRNRNPQVPVLRSDGTGLAKKLGDLADAVVCLAVLIHHRYADATRIMRGLRRAVRPGGLLILDWPTSDTPEEARGWLEVSTWHPSEQLRTAAHIGLKPVDRGLPWSTWTTA